MNMRKVTGMFVGAVMASLSLPVAADTGVISACVSKTGSLRLADAAGCTTKETLLQWNQAGPAGAPGAQGPAGAPGAQGPAGPSDAYMASSGFDPVFFASGETVTLATLNLPVGHYVLDAKVMVGNTSSSDDAAELTCGLRYGAGGSGAIDITSATRLFKGAPYAAGSYTTLPLAGSLDIATGDENPVVLNCVTTSDRSFAQFAKLNAIAVSALHAQ